MQLAVAASASGAHAGPCARESRDVASAAAARGAFVTAAARPDGRSARCAQKSALRLRCRCRSRACSMEPELVAFITNLLPFLAQYSDRIISMRTLFES